MLLEHALILLSNASIREELLTRQYAYHSLKDQQTHWRYADEAYQELGQVRADHARHRKYRSYVSHYTDILSRSLPALHVILKGLQRPLGPR